MEKWEPGTYNFISCKECNYLVSFDSKFHTSFDKFLSIENISIPKMSEHLSFTEMFSTVNHTSRLSEHLSATEMFWTTLTAYMFWGEYFYFNEFT